MTRREYTEVVDADNFLFVDVNDGIYDLCLWKYFSVCISSVQSLSRVWLFATPWIAARQASLSITISGVHSDSCPSSRWCHPAIPSSVIPFSSCPQSLPASQSFPVSQLFAWGGQSTGVSALASFFPETKFSQIKRNIMNGFLKVAKESFEEK